MCGNNYHMHSCQSTRSNEDCNLTTAEWKVDCDTLKTLQGIWSSMKKVYLGGSKVNFFLSIDLFYCTELRKKLKVIQERIQDGDKNICLFIESGLK